ncbi:hypothetical protein ABT173_27195 [Streptomyces sp. NPDC001795]|uniref:hypothetical protein n=1 Tax=unclassified Streptomyces TaxID=2593676 RepID=UPI003323641B
MTCARARSPTAEREGWLDEVEGLRVSLASAEEKLAQIDHRRDSHTVVDLGIPTPRKAAADPTAQ